MKMNHSWSYIDRVLTAVFVPKMAFSELSASDEKAVLIIRPDIAYAFFVYCRS